VLMQLQESPANNVVILVVCNTDYIYKGEETRKTHFDYRLKMGTNVYQPAKAQIKWYAYPTTLRDPDFTKPATGIETIDLGEENNANKAVTFSVSPSRTVVARGETIEINITAATQWQVPVRLVNSSGAVVYQQSLLRNGSYEIPSGITPGLYILQAQNGNEKASVKMIIK